MTSNNNTSLQFESNNEEVTIITDGKQEESNCIINNDNVTDTNNVNGNENKTSTPISRRNNRKRIAFILNPTSGGGLAAVEWDKRIEVALHMMWPTTATTNTTNTTTPTTSNNATNPNNTRNANKQPTSNINSTLVNKNITWQVWRTLHGNHAPQLAKEAIEAGFNVIVSCGGDGTHSQVVNGYMQANGKQAGVELAIIPIGTGSDLSKTLEYSSILQQQLLLIADGLSVELDVGHLKYTPMKPTDKSDVYFINIASCGVTGNIAKAVNASSKRFGGLASFFAATVIESLKWSDKKARFQLDDGEWINCNLNQLVVANGKYFGGGMLMAPQASMTDGLFDVVLLHDISVFDVNILLKVYTGEHLLFKNKANHYRASKITAEAIEDGNSKINGKNNSSSSSSSSSSSAILIEVDGEDSGSLPATWYLLPRSAYFIVPPSFYQQNHSISNASTTTVTAKSTTNTNAII